MNIIYLLIGGNMGDRISNLAKAADLLEKETGKIIKRSSIYETGAWGNTNQPDFLNQVIIIQTALSAADYIRQIFSIENTMGRVRTEKNAPRIIDIDILFFNDAVINEEHLTIPHPQIQNRRFVLIPMNELSPALVHPVLHQTISNLLSTCKDALEVRLLNQL